MEPFWYNDLSVLLEPSKLKKYIPLKSYSKEEKLNSIVRLGFLYVNLFIILTSNINYLFVGIFCLIITLLIHTNENNSKVKRIKKMLKNMKILRKMKQLKKKNKCR